MISSARFDDPLTTTTPPVCVCESNNDALLAPVTHAGELPLLCTASLSPLSAPLEEQPGRFEKRASTVTSHVGSRGIDTDIVCCPPVQLPVVPAPQFTPPNAVKLHPARQPHPGPETVNEPEKHCPLASVSTRVKNQNRHARTPSDIAMNLKLQKSKY